jgi:hypothetical protein
MVRFKTGDTFIHVGSEWLQSHLWAVISDTEQAPDQVVIVNLTSYRDDKDQSCILDIDDHPFITRKTLISYRDAKLQETADLAKLSHNFTQRDPLSVATLDKIREGAKKSRFLPERVRNFLDSQGLI